MAGILDLFNSENFMPHGHCFLWLPQILWLHVISDMVIAAAYYSIPASLLYFVGRRADIPFKNMFYLFGAFILLCGTTHLMAIWVIWHPDYGAEGVLKAVTAIVSIGTAAASWKIIPQALNLKGPSQLQEVNEELRRSYENIEDIVAKRTAELSTVNERLQKSENDLQMALITAQEASTAKSDFLATMSHEIRTPMNAVMGVANILSLSAPLTDKQREFIQTLKSSADQLLSLINDLLDIAKIESQSIELELIPFNIKDVVAEVTDMLDIAVRKKDLSIRYTVAADCIGERAFVGDPARLRQILLNLCSNAVKFTEKGTVTIGVACEPTGIKDIEKLVLSVSDTGIGIPADMLETVFAKFVQADSSISRKYGGTGLGLSITKELITCMGGQIAVASELGRGSIFTVTVPLKRTWEAAAQKSSEESATPQPVAATGVRVLLVEDNYANALVATTFIEQFGYTYDVAANATIALEKLRGGNVYGAILMDVQMPGMNGYDATQTIRALEKSLNQPRTPIIGMTAHAMAGDRERCLAAGMDDYLSKPFDPVKLEEKIRKAVSFSAILAARYRQTAP